MDFQIKVRFVSGSGAQRVEKLFVSRDLLNPPRRKTLLTILQQRIPKIMSMTQPVIEYLDDEEDFCILRDDKHAFLEMLNCAKEIEGHSYRLNLRITEPYSPTDARLACESTVPTSVDSKPATKSSRPIFHSKKKLSYDGEPENDSKRVQKAPEENREMSKKTSPLESFLTSQQTEIEKQRLKVETFQKQIDNYKGERTPTSVSSLPVCSKCHLREGHNRLNCPYPLACTSAVYCKNIDKHPDEKTFLKELVKDGNEENRKLSAMREELKLKQKAAASVSKRYVTRVKDTLIATDPEKYIRNVNGTFIEDWRKINADAKILEKSCKGKLPSPEQAKEVLMSTPKPPTVTGKTSVHNPYKKLWETHGVTWPAIAAGTVRTYSQRSRSEQVFTAGASCSSACESDTQDEHWCFTNDSSPPVKSPLRKKSSSQDYDYEFALGLQESFKTLPPHFDFEEFERKTSDDSLSDLSKPAHDSMISTLHTAQQSQPYSTMPTSPSALNLQTLANAVKLVERLPDKQ